MFASPVIAEELILCDDPTIHAAVMQTLSRFGTGALNFAYRAGMRVVPLKSAEHYSHRSSALRRLRVDVDSWAAPPAGLFVVEEKTVYLRSRSSMTVAHEFGHAIDCALGGGVYRSTIDSNIQCMFRKAGEFVTPYAATAVDEYFAESLRAYVESNDPKSLWPRATRARLRALDRDMFDFINDLFANELSLPIGTARTDCPN
ncbi:MAG: hypothetical protein M3Z14_05660 [Candidatus Eremiobacteraeota bacterium]|nr:hypothetical protein [Candidatus Eremiobacteraeota bacterium]